MAINKLTVSTLNLTVDAGTPTRFNASNLYCLSAVIYFHRDSSGLLYIGTSSASATNDNAIVLEPGGFYRLEFELNRTVAREYNLYDFWYDGSVNAEKINVHYTR